MLNGSRSNSPSFVYVFLFILERPVHLVESGRRYILSKIPSTERRRRENKIDFSPSLAASVSHPRRGWGRITNGGVCVYGLPEC